jgi:predicted  nucleic acid-binding Zn-ribbon protein
MKQCRTLGAFLLLASSLAAAAGLFSFAGVSRVIQERYRSNYENKALYLKVPVFSEKQFVFISGSTFRHDLAPAGAPRYKVGDQLRVLGIDFGGEEIKFKLGAIAAGPAAAAVELIYRFDSPLQENFPNSPVFDRALAGTFTEGLKYTELDEAKRTYIEQEFERASREIATSAGASRETVLKYVAPLLPAYQDLTRDLDSQQNRNQDLSRQLERAHAENKKLDGENRNQQGEIGRLRTQAASLQEKIDNSTAQLARLGEDIRVAKGISQSYQKELSNLQRSLKIRVDPGRDLASQIADLGQVMQKTQKDIDELQGENSTLKTNLDRELSDNARLTGENQDLKASIRQKEDTIRTLTSKEDSLAHQYIVLKQVKDNLENVALALSNFNTQIVDETAENGIKSGTVQVYLGSTLIGTMEYRLPERIGSNEEKTAEVQFAVESIDNVRLTPAERRIRESLGERLKLHVSLLPRSDTLTVRPERENVAQEISERDRAIWRWRIVNHGGRDSRLALWAQLVNKNGDEIPLIHTEEPVLSYNLVRQVRNYLQPISLGVGALIGALLMCITGLFRRVRHVSPAKEHASAAPPYPGRKQL